MNFNSDKPLNSKVNATDGVIMLVLFSSTVQMQIQKLNAKQPLAQLLQWKPVSVLIAFYRATVHTMSGVHHM